MFYVTFFPHEPPLFDAEPQEGEGARSVRVDLGEQAEVVSALLGLKSFGVALALAAVFEAGVNARERRGPTARSL